MSLRTFVFSLLVASVTCFAAGPVHAQDPTLAAPPPASESLLPSPARAQHVAVVGGPGARDEAFALARLVYQGRLRPPELDEIRARVLAGDPAPEQSTRALVELAEVRRAITGDDAPSRALLGTLAKEASADALVLVFAAPEAGGARAGVQARVYLTAGGMYDAARYAPDGVGKEPSDWRNVVASLEQRFPAPSPVVSAPAAALKPVEPAKSRPFYATGWFWGAVAATALIGGAFYVATRDTSSDTIHLQMHVPR